MYRAKCDRELLMSNSEGNTGVLELSCGTQHYDWGKVGKESFVFKLVSKNSDPKPNTSKPYAELWMGTHPNLPSFVKRAGISVKLKDFMDQEHLSEFVYQKYGDLPFLFKVLSINSPLSIQSHPDKCSAEKLHSNRPEVYKDPNHKPEMVIGITKLQAYVGFKQFHSLRSTVQKFTELQEVIGLKGCDLYFSDNVKSPDPDFVSAALRFSIEAIFHCDKRLMETQLKKLNDRVLKNSTLDGENIGLNALLEHYPGDSGCLFALLLNYVELNPGEAVFILPNEPHCYIHGDGIECMATSDNVIRVGCTPKYKDLDTFLNTISYNPRPLEKIILHQDTSPHLDGLKIYSPPISEFFIACFEGKIPNEGIAIASIDGPSIAIVVSPSKLLFCKKKASMGSVFFVPINTQIRLDQIEQKQEEVKIYIASTKIS